MSDNSIPLGLDWLGQQFDFPDGFFQPGDAIRCEFRRSVYDAEPIVTLTDGAGTRIVGSSLFISMTADQTKRFRKPGDVRTSPLLIRGERQIFLDILIEIEVVQPATRGAP